MAENGRTPGLSQKTGPAQINLQEVTGSSHPEDGRSWITTDEKPNEVKSLSSCYLLK